MTDYRRRFKIEYVDSGGNTQVIAETGQDNGNLQIDRHIHIRKVNDPDILKLWLDGGDFGNAVPTRLSEFDTAQNGENEPEILYKQYDADVPGFVTQGRFYAKNTGTINDNGELALKLYSFMKYTAEQQVNTGSITSDIEGALNAVLPSGYVANVPSGVSPPSVNDYSLNGRREKGYQELTRNYNYALTFTDELDANNDYKVKFEPVGQGGTVDTISQDDVTDGNDAVLFKSWQKDKTDSIVNKVTVEGTDSSGNKVTETVRNQVQIDDFGEKFRKFKVGYIQSNLEAANIGSGYLTPGEEEVSIVGVDTTNNVFSISGDKTSRLLTDDTVRVNGSTGNDGVFTVSSSSYDSTNDETDITVNENVSDSTADGEISIDKTKVPESGTLKTPVYHETEVNNSFSVIDDKRNIDDTFTLVKQTNFWPEGTSELRFEFEQEGLEKKAKESENLRDERARLYPENQKDVGSQNVNADTENVDDSYDTQANQDHPHSVGGKDSTNDGGASVISSSDDSLSLGTLTGGIFNTIATLDGGSVDSAGAYFWFSLNVVPSSGPSASETEELVTYDFVVRDTTNGKDIPVNFPQLFSVHAAIDTNADGDADTFVGSGLNGFIPIPNNTNGNTYEIRIRPDEDVDASAESQISVVEEHFHTVEFEADRALGTSDGATNATNTSDTNAGNTTSLNATGSTDAKNVNVASEDKTDR